MFLQIKKFLRNDDGPTAVEYAVMMALIIAAVIGSLHLVGNKAVLSFTKSAVELTSAFGP
jgi:pilus assembly protein Flp/PilA